MFPEFLDVHWNVTSTNPPVSMGDNSRIHGINKKTVWTPKTGPNPVSRTPGDWFALSSQNFSQIHLNSPLAPAFWLLGEATRRTKRNELRTSPWTFGVQAVLVRALTHLEGGWCRFLDSTAGFWSENIVEPLLYIYSIVKMKRSSMP